MNTFLLTIEFEQENNTTEWKERKSNFEESFGQTVKELIELPPKTTYIVKTSEKKNIKNYVVDKLNYHDHYAYCSTERTIRSR